MFEDLPDLVIPEAVLPNLMTQSAQLTRLSGQIFLDYEIKNIGQALASRNFTRFYYSSDSVLDSSDLDVGSYDELSRG